MKRLLMALAVAATTILPGCASLGFGNDEYACPGPNGVRCKSAREIYADTNSADIVEGREPENYTESEPAGSEQWYLNENPPPASSKKDNKRIEVVRRNIDLINLPKVDTPRPIRTPSQVMRIWVAPWEDKDTDLVWAQLIYTEVEKRKWNYGNQLHTKEQTLHPLEVKAREASQARASQPEDSNSKKGARK